MKKFKKFTGVIMLLTAAFLIISLVGSGKLISSAASGKVTSPTLKYAYAKANGDVTISFKSVKYATKYRIYRKTSKTEWVKISDTTETTYTDQTAEKNVTYYYTVKACRITNENTYWSKIVDKVKSIKIYPAKPLLKAAKATAEGIKVTWNSTENTTKYFVYRKTDGTEWTHIETTSKTTFLDKDYEKGVTYYYSIKAVKIVDSIKYPSSMDNTGLSCVSFYPVAPTMQLAVLTGVGAHIQWSDIPNETYYIVYRKQPNTEWTQIATTEADSTCYLDKTANDYESYYYTVQAVTTVDNVSYYSAYDSTGILMGRTESDFKITSLCLNGFLKPIIKWDQYENAAGYVIYRKSSKEADYTKIKDIKKGHVTSYTDIRANYKSEYTYVVKPYFTEKNNIGLYAIATINIPEFSGEVNVDPDKANNAITSTEETNNVTAETTNTSNYTESTNVVQKNNTEASDIINNVPNSRYKGLSFSVLGDDNSTFSGYSSSNNSYYPTNSVATVNDMWWKKTADKLGMSINKVNAVSGRRVTTTKAGNTSAIESCTNIGSPNVLIIYVGINDFINNVPLGEYTGCTTSLTEQTAENTNTFTSAYAVMINKIKRNNPGTEIILCTLPTTKTTNDNGESINTWNERIRQLAGGFGLKVIDFANSGAASNLTDGIHPNAVGQDNLYNTTVNRLK